jgi:chromosome partitioning protein
MRSLIAFRMNPERKIQRIVVLNPKGGSGKTTIAVNLAGYFAATGRKPVLMDYDPQGSSTRWVRKRSEEQPRVHLITAYERDPRVTRSFQLRIPEGCQRVVLDTPAAVPPQQLPELVGGADKILVPVLPSDIDIHACSRCIASLLLVAKVRRQDQRLGIIANRVRRNTLIYESLVRFLRTLDIPIVATLRDSQSYIRSAELGMGIHEMKTTQVEEDLPQWEPLLQWLDGVPRERASPTAPAAAPAPSPAPAGTPQVVQPDRAQAAAHDNPAHDSAAQDSAAQDSAAQDDAAQNDQCIVA